MNVMKRSDFDSDDSGDIGEDMGEEYNDDHELVTRGELKKVDKEINSLYSTIDTLRSLVDETQRDIKTFKTRVGDEFSWKLYREHLVEHTTAMDLFKKDVSNEQNKIKASVKDVAQQELADRKSLF